MKIEWQDSYRTGNDRIDEQHEMLVRMNAIGASIGRRQATDEEVSDFISKWVMVHSATEDAKIAAHIRQRAV